MKGYPLHFNESFWFKNEICELKVPFQVTVSHFFQRKLNFGFVSSWEKGGF